MLEETEMHERNRKILELYESGWKHKSIGEKFGITQWRVQQILAQLGYTPRSLTKVTEQNLRRLHAKGLTNPQLAAEFSVDPTTIRNKLVKYGLQRNPAPKKIKKICRAENCPDTGTRRGYCQKHYARLIKYGNPLTVSKAGRRPKR